MAAIEESLKQFIDSFLKEKMGVHYGSFQKIIEDKYNYLLDRVKETVNGVNTRTDGKLREQDSKIASLQQEINELKRKISALSSAQTAKPVPPARIEQQVQPSAPDSALTMFNAWAANPARLLPQGFSYVSGDFNIRTQQPMPLASAPTKWIINVTGPKKYLLPNPNLFHPNTNIGELYKMDQTRLKPAGQNKIKIVVPCVMTDNTGPGYIEFAGELTLLS